MTNDEIRMGATEPRRSPTPRFSDEAHRRVAEVFADLAPSEDSARRRAALVLSAPEVIAEFDAVFAQGQYSGQETAARDLAGRLREHAHGKRDAAQRARDSGVGSAWAAAEFIDAGRFEAVADLIEQWAAADALTRAGQELGLPDGEAT